MTDVHVWAILSEFRFIPSKNRRNAASSTYFREIFTVFAAIEWRAFGFAARLFDLRFH